MVSGETLRVASLLAEEVKGSPFVDEWKRLLKNGDWLGLVSHKADPRNYTDAEAYWSDNLISSFLRKNEAIDAGIDLEAKAVKAFLSAEAQCFKTNRRLYALYHNFSQDVVDVRAHSIMLRARKIIQEIIGHRPRSSQRSECLISGEIPDYVSGAAHGPGATLSDMSLVCCIPDKFISVPTLTVEVNPLLEDWVSTKWGESHLERCAIDPTRAVKIVKSGQFFTVHKHATQRRGCEKQPSVNVWYQLGLGRELRRLFKPYVDLEKAKERHARMAQVGSAFGTYATIDLEQASDTVADMLVTCLWPSAWVKHLRMLRTKSAVLPDGSVHRLEKFSSMGNGFTFELESITFYALALAAAGWESTIGKVPFLRGAYSVLGDDIIVPNHEAREVSAVLQYFGFILNREKTFSSGPFRESCGFDAFKGVPVRGYFQEKSIEQPAHIISALNGIRRSALAGGCVAERWRIVSKAWHYLNGLLPREVRSCRGPESLGDLVIHVPEEQWRSRTVNSIRMFRAYSPSEFTEFSLEKYWNQTVVLATKLYGVPAQDPKGRQETWIRPRGDPKAYRTVWVTCS